jgi:hypothetical protein
MSEKGLWFCIIQIFICSGIAEDVPFVFDESYKGLSGFTSDQLIRMSASAQDLKGAASDYIAFRRCDYTIYRYRWWQCAR